jgi:hypothetical protein
MRIDSVREVSDLFSSGKNGKETDACNIQTERIAELAKESAELVRFGIDQE